LQGRNQFHESNAIRRRSLKPHDEIACIGRPSGAVHGQSFDQICLLEFVLDKAFGTAQLTCQGVNGICICSGDSNCKLSRGE
jgi:hypothetical protein